MSGHATQKMVVVEGLESQRLLTAVNSYTQTNLVSNGPVSAQTTDANLVNGWGLAAAPRGPFWVSNNGTGLSTAYSGSTIVPPTVTIPHGSAADSAAPTGVVYNSSLGFRIGTAPLQRRALYLFSGEDGTVSAWNPTVDLNNALLEVDNSDSGAIYKGLTIARFGLRPLLYVADFHGAKIDVFDSRFQPRTLPGTFTDPDLPDGYAPFNIVNLRGVLFVAYAQQDELAEDEVAGPGLGFVDIFTSSGRFVRRFASQGTLNAPWGIALAPLNFGAFSNDILVGNFGDGTINAFNRDGTLDGQLEDSDGAVIAIDGLWGLAFGNGYAAGRRNALYFAAGPNAEADGLFGRLTVNASSYTPFISGNNTRAFADIATASFSHQHIIDQILDEGL